MSASACARCPASWPARSSGGRRIARIRRSSPWGTGQPIVMSVLPVLAPDALDLHRQRRQQARIPPALLLDTRAALLPASWSSVAKETQRQVELPDRARSRARRWRRRAWRRAGLPPWRGGVSKAMRIRGQSRESAESQRRSYPGARAAAPRDARDRCPGHPPAAAAPSGSGSTPAGIAGQRA